MTAMKMSLRAPTVASRASTMHSVASDGTECSVIASSSNRHCAEATPARVSINPELAIKLIRLA